MSARSGQCAMAALAAIINSTVVAVSIEILQVSLMGANLDVVDDLARASQSPSNSRYAVRGRNYIAVSRSYC